VRNAAQIGVAYLLLLFVGAVWRLFPFSELVPDLPVLFAAYLGLHARAKLAPSIASAAIIGYFADLLYGTPVGLVALVSGLICALCHVVQGRLLVRGSIFISVFAFVVALLAQLLLILIRDVAGLLSRGWTNTIGMIVLCAVLTGLSGPPVFRLCRYMDSRFAKTRRERDAAASGG